MPDTKTRPHSTEGTPYEQSGYTTQNAHIKYATCTTSHTSRPHCQKERTLRWYPRPRSIEKCRPGSPAAKILPKSRGNVLWPWHIHFQLSRVIFPSTVSFLFPLADHQISGSFQGNLRFFSSQRRPCREKIRINNHKIRNSSRFIRILVAAHFEGNNTSKSAAAKRVFSCHFTLSAQRT